MTPRRRDSMVLPSWAPWLVLLPLAVILADGALSEAFAWHGPVSDIAAAGSLDPRLEAMGRTRVLASLLPFMLVSTLLTIQAAGEAALLFGRQARRRLALPLLLWLAAAAWILFRQSTGHAAPEQSMGANFIEDTLGRVTLPGSRHSAKYALEWAMWIFRIFLVVGAGAAILATLSCLAQPTRALPVRARRYYRDMQRRRLVTYLYASALLLVTGLFFVDSCYRWPAPFSTRPKLYSDHVDSLMLANGIFYTTIIASYYVPVALWMSRSAIAGTPGEKEADDDRLSPAHMVKAFLALISPAIAGVLTHFAEGL